MPIVLKSGSLNLLEHSGPVQACNGIAFYAYMHYTRTHTNVHTHTYKILSQCVEAEHAILLVTVVTCIWEVSL